MKLGKKRHSCLAYCTLPPPVTRAVFLHETDWLSDIWECFINGFPVFFCLNQAPIFVVALGHSAHHKLTTRLRLPDRENRLVTLPDSCLAVIRRQSLSCLAMDRLLSRLHHLHWQQPRMEERGENPGELQVLALEHKDRAPDVDERLLKDNARQVCEG